MRFRSCLLALAFCGFSVAPIESAFATEALAPEEALVRSVYLTGVIEVDAEGKVEKIGLRRSDLLPVIEKRVLDQVHGWQFNPYLVEGVPRRIRTSMSLRLDQIKEGEGFRLDFGAIEFGQPLMQNVTAPRYPDTALRSELAAEVLMLVNVDGKGHVVSSEPVRARITNRVMRSERQHRDRVEPFIASAQAAIAHWTFDFVEVSADGQPQQMLVPVKYALARPKRGKADNAPILFRLPGASADSLDGLIARLDGESEPRPLRPQASPLTLRNMAHALKL